ncbi:hypothetical protein [Porphyromonas loveana]
MSKKKHLALPRATMLRKKAIQIRLNEAEHKALDAYCSRFGVENRSRWIRELLMSEVIHRLESDVPLLFREEEMR